MCLVNNSEVLEKLEELLATWQKQIEQVLTEAEQIRREADNIGPTAELSYWKGRMAKFNTSVDYSFFLIGVVICLGALPSKFFSPKIRVNFGSGLGPGLTWE